MADADMAEMLNQLPTQGADDYVTKVLEIYQGVMNVYEPAEVQRRSALAALDETGRSLGVSTSANW